MFTFLRVLQRGCAYGTVFLRSGGSDGTDFFLQRVGSDGADLEFFHSYKGLSPMETAIDNHLYFGGNPLQKKPYTSVQLGIPPFATSCIFHFFKLWHVCNHHLRLLLSMPHRGNPFVTNNPFAFAP